jgi:protein-S-isoprenylcysteine O-methyltransferase Ste14
MLPLIFRVCAFFFFLQDAHPPPPTSPARWLSEAAAVGCYALNNASFLAVAGFSSNLSLMARFRVDGDGRSKSTIHAGTVVALVCNLFLFLGFCAQHSLQGRTAVQERSKRGIGHGGERLAHLLGSIFFMYALLGLWTPVTQYDVWHLPSGMEAAALHNSDALYLFRVLLGALLDLLQVVSWCWLLASLATIFLYDAFRYRQAFVPHLSLPCVTAVKPRPPFVYRVTRQPLFSSLLGIMWSTPQMTLGRFCWSVAWTLYTLVGCTLQERDMLRQQADKDDTTLRDYMRRVPRLLPRPLWSPASDAECDAIMQGPTAWFKAIMGLSA